jgi:hypothetical protein
MCGLFAVFIINIFAAFAMTSGGLLCHRKHTTITATTTPTLN